MSNVFTPLPVPRYDEGILRYLNESFLALARIINSGQVSTPPGTIQHTVASSEPDGWLFINGQSVLLDDFPDLALVVPAAWIVGSNIVLPDWRGRVLVAAGTGTGLTNRVLNTTGGAETHALVEAEMPSHNHSITMVGTLGAHVHDDGTGRIAQAGIGFVPGSATTTGNKGSGTAHNNMQPWAAVNLMIKY